MNASSLHALVIDRHLRELSPEAVELLDWHLAQHPEAQAEADRILQALSATSEALLRHPELALAPHPLTKESPAPSLSMAPVRRSMFGRFQLARAAAVLIIGVLAGVTGYMAGRWTSPLAEAQTASASQAEEAATQARAPLPWARYRTRFDPTGEGVRIVRVDTGETNWRSVP